MGADNWAICPRCKRDALKAKEAEQQKVGKAYGKVKPEEYLAMFEEAAKPVKLEQTLREDYDIGIDEDGGFLVSYRGACSRCGFGHTFKEKQQLTVG